MLVIGSLCVVSALIFLSVRDRPVDETDSESPELTADGGPTSLRDDLRSVLAARTSGPSAFSTFGSSASTLPSLACGASRHLVHLYDLFRRARVAVRPRWQRRPAYWLTAVWVDCGPYRRSHRAGVDLNARVLCRLRHLFSSRDTALAFVGILFTAMFVNGGVSLTFTVGVSDLPDEVSGTVSGTINSVGYFRRRRARNGYGARCLLDRKIVDGTPVYLLQAIVLRSVSPQLPASRPRVCTLDSPDSTAKIALCDQRTDS